MTQINLKNLNSYSIKDLIDILRRADDLYFNGYESFLTDEEYDTIREYAKSAAPFHKYFTGIGSDVRGGKVNLPYQMGSLDQVYHGEIEDWVRKWNLDQEKIILTDKLDGTSGMIVYDDNGNLQIAYSRGNGIQGADITRHLKRIVPNTIPKGPLVVRGEIIISQASFKILSSKVTSRNGTHYRNARNMVAGLMNAEENDETVYEYVDFVAYDVLNLQLDKVEMLTLLHDECQLNTPHYVEWFGSELTDNVLITYLKKRKQQSKYEIDGIVIDAKDVEVRTKMNPTRDTLNPAYSVKYKVTDDSNIAVTTVKKVHWNVSKHGYLKPRIEIEPVELVGVTITFCTGFNAKFIRDNKIGPGAKIEITRSGDVIPFCRKVIEGTNPELPKEQYEWTVNEEGEQVDIVLIDKHNNQEVLIHQLVDFFTAIDTPHLKKGNIIKLVDEGYDSAVNIIKMSEEELVSILGTNGSKIYHGLKKSLTNIPLYKLIGAFSSERGIGIRKIKKLYQEVGQDRLLQLSENDIVNCEGFDEKTAQQVVRVLEKFQHFFNEVKSYVTITQENSTTNEQLKNVKFCFTGFRNKQLQEQIELLGGIVQNSVSGKTNYVVTTNPNGTSSKLKKARSLNIPIIDIKTLEDMLNV